MMKQNFKPKLCCADELKKSQVLGQAWKGKLKNGINYLTQYTPGHVRIIIQIINLIFEMGDDSQTRESKTRKQRFEIKVDMQIGRK